MSEIVIGEFEIVADPSPPAADTSDAAPPTATIELIDLEAVVHQLQARSLRFWID